MIDIASLTANELFEIKSGDLSSVDLAKLTLKELKNLKKIFKPGLF